MKIQTILFGWSVAVLLCPALLTAQQSNAVVEAAQPVRRVISHQELIPTPQIPTVGEPVYQDAPIVMAQPSPVSSSSCNGCAHSCQTCQTRQTCQRQCAANRCGATRNSYQNLSAATPFGDSTRQILHAQIAKGSEAQMVFYHLHFMYRDGQWQLSPAGHVHCETVCDLMNNLPTAANLLVEATGNGQIDEVKKRLVVEQLNARGCWIQAGQVHVGKPRRLGISGPEALIIYQNRLGQIGNSPLGSSRGNSSSFSGNTSFGGTSGSSTSGSSSGFTR